MDEDQLRWNLYQSLKDEMVRADALNYQLLGILLATSAAIVTAAFNQPDPLLRTFMFGGVGVATVPGYRLLQGNRRRTWRISTYLRIFIEPYLRHVSWETDLAEQRLVRGEKKYSIFSTLVSVNEWYVLTLVNVVALLGAIFFGIFQTSYPIEVKLTAAVALVIGASAVVSRSYGIEVGLRRGGRIELDYYQSWQQLDKSRLRKDEPMPSPLDRGMGTMP